MRLTREDYAALDQSYITRKIADEAGLYRVPSIDGLAVLGRNGGSGDFAGIVIPYRWPGEKHVTLERLRLDNPPVDAATGKPRHKYLSPKRPSHLYLPRCALGLLSDVHVPVVITEGEKKCLALWRAALESANDTATPTFLPVAVAGVWNWLGQVGIRTNASGQRVPEKGVIPDFDRIVWTGRKVTILFDANVAANDMVRGARRQLAAELTRRGAEVWLAEIPLSVNLNGIDDYLAKFGLTSALELIKKAVRYDWTKELIKSHSGKILRLLANAITALRSAPEWAGVLAFDEFSLSVTTMRPTPWGAVEKWTEQDDRLLTNWLQHHGICVSDGDAAKAVETVARDRGYHPVRQYLDSLKWDGTGRIDDWPTLYLGADPSDLTRAFGAKWLISAVARVYDPGCQADHMLVLEGPQGQGKSTALRILADPWFSDDLPELGTKDAAILIFGVWIMELSELDAMSRAETSRVKSFITRRVDRFRPPYGRRPVDGPRQSILAGTVNQPEYLRDETGGRRFWPVKCGRIDLDGLRRVRDQLWAEAVVRYRAGEKWWLEGKQLNRDAQEEQDDRYQRDAWEDKIRPWLDLRAPKEVTTSDVLEHALQKPAGTWTRGDETRVGIALRRLKWEPEREGSGDRRRFYRPTNPT